MKRFSLAARAALSAVVALTLSASSQAGLLVKYDFEGGNTIASELDSEVLAGTFNGDTHGTFTDSAYLFSPTSATSEIEAPFATLSMSALAGSSLVLDRLVFSAAFLGEMGQGILGARFVGNGSNFEQEISATQFPTYTEYSISLAGMNLLNDTLKLYAYSEDGSTNTQIKLDNVQIHGKTVPTEVPDVPQAPEPSTLALLGLGAFGYGAARLRRRRNQATESAA